MRRLFYVLIIFVYLILSMPPGSTVWAAERQPVEEAPLTEEDQTIEEGVPTDENLPAAEISSWEQTGIIRYELGYHWLLSGETGPANAQTGIQQQYYVDLKGHLVLPRQDLSYALSLTPENGLEGEFLWANPWFKAQYDQGIRLRFSNLKIAFANHEIDGFSFQTKDNSVIAFAGNESYIPQSKTILIANPNENIYYLYENGSAGDIVQQSELILLNGTLLTPQRDYTLNYLNGKLKLFVPLAEGMRIEAKYFFILHNPDLIDARGEFLAGIVLNRSWVENSLSAFYMQRGENLNKVGGIAGRITYGPVTLQGEWALSKAAQTISEDKSDSAPNHEVAAAYDITGSFNHDQIRLTYELRDVNPVFQEIGVVPYLKGKSNLLDLILPLKEGSFQWKSSEYIVRDGGVEQVASDQMGILKCDLAPHHVAQWIFQKKDTQVGDLVKSDNDFSIGYIFETRPLTVSVGQSIQTPDNRFIKLKVNQANLILDGLYTVETLWNGKEHQLNLESTYRPVQQVELNSFLEYRHPFETQKGNTFLQLNGNWNPTSAWSTSTGYVYSHHSIYQSSNRRYYVMANYQVTGRNSNLYLEHSNLDSPTAHSTDTEMSWNYGMTLFSKYQLHYQIQHNHFIETDKTLGQDLQASTEHLQNIVLQYHINDNYTCSAKAGYNRQDLMNWGSWDHTAGTSGGVDFRYRFGEERDIYLGAEFQQGGRDSAIHLNSRVQLPLGKGKVDYLGDFSIPLQRRGETKTTLHLQLTAPTLWKITPELLYESESASRGSWKRLKEVYSGILRYSWTEKRSIVFEVKREYASNPNEPTENYSSFGMYTGIEFEF